MIWNEQIHSDEVTLHVMVPAPACAASVALQAEGIEHYAALMYGRTDYCRAFAEQWRKGEGFIIVEHDVIPWPGALAELERCSEDVCGYRYPLGRAGKIGGTLGCIRFSERLVQSDPSLPDRLGDPWWGNLDGHLFAALGIDDFHVHGPPVAHLKEMLA